MRTLAAVLFLATLWFALPDRATPVVAQEKPGVVKWEYAELTYRTIPGRGPGKDPDGKEVPAREGATTVRWTTGAEDVSLKGWGELADKLKVQLKAKLKSPSGKSRTVKKKLTLKPKS